MLTRRVGEAVDLSIDGRILATVKVLALLPNNQIRMGFDADPAVTIMRDNAKRRMDDGEETDTDGNR